MNSSLMIRAPLRKISEFANVTDYVANGSFAALRNNVTYRKEPDYAILVRLVDHNSNWAGPFVYVDKDSFDFLRKTALEPGDVLICNVGAAGTVFCVPDLGCPMTLGPNSLVLKGLAVPRYWYFFFSSPQGQATIQSIISGSAQPKFNKTDLRACLVPFPREKHQHRVASVLGALDDKIDLNRRINETLEAMARAIFKDWFVDFGPTRAKAEGRAPYLPPELWELFPDALDDQGKPVEWSIYTLSDLAQHHRATLSPSAQPERTFEHYSIPAYDAGNEPAMDLGGSIKSNKTIVPDGAVLLSKLNPEIERVWLPNTAGEAPQVASTEFLALTPLAPATCGVLYWLFQSPGFRAEMAARVTGTSKSHQRVPPKSLLACEVLAANPCLLALFEEKVGPMMNRLLSNRRESGELAQTRDILLPKLMSGEVRLRDAEHVVGEVA